MIVRRMEQDSLRSISPSAIESYLSALGWTKGSTLAGRGTLWSLTGDGRDEQLLVPLSRSLRDYGRRVAEIVDVVASTTGNDVHDIVDRLSTTLDDVILLSLKGPDVATGTIPATDGQAFFQHAVELVKSAVAGIVDPRPFYARRRPPKADAYLKSVRFGQTRVGSYQIQLVSKLVNLPIDFSIQSQPAPFERRAVVGLVAAVRSLISASEEALATNELEPFSAVVENGVSANLCSSVWGMCQTSKRRDLAIDIIWSDRLGRPAETADHVQVDQKLLDVIRAGGEYLRTGTEEPNVTISGYVTRLHREAGEEEGDVTIVSVVEGEQRKVKVVGMSTALYTRAIHAHDHGTAIQLTGDLQKVGVYYRLTSPKASSAQEAGNE